ncbi:MAG TPA: hypothetical protein VFZ98_10295 [Vicinamibacterales bacterium]
MNGRKYEWQTEDDIKAELRMLTAELRHLREELRSMVSPPKPTRARTLMHRQYRSQRTSAAPPNEPIAEAAEANREPPKRQKK